MPGDSSIARKFDGIRGLPLGAATPSSLTQRTTPRRLLPASSRRAASRMTSRSIGSTAERSFVP
jgi:hypothetical protein